MKRHSLKFIKKILKVLARATIRRYKPGVIGIAGSVGKTSTKEALRLVLCAERKVRAASKNFNNEIGLPLAVLGDWEEIGDFRFYGKVIISSFLQLLFKRRSYPKILILEYGIDAQSDMKKLLEIARPQIGIMTAIGDVPAHLEFFPSRDALIREKARLISSLPATGFAILNCDEKVVSDMKKITRAHTLSFGISERSDIRADSIETRFRDRVFDTTFKLVYGGKVVPVRLHNVIGIQSVYAALAASATAIAFGVNVLKIAEALGTFQPLAGRMRPMPGIKNSLIIDDTYNASPKAVEEALSAVKNIRAKRRIAVLGDMLELGDHDISAHKAIGKKLVGAVKLLITVGDKAKFIAEAAAENGMARQNIITCDNPLEAGESLRKILEPDDIVLVKGSQSVRMEQVVREVMAEPDKADKLLVRQSKAWLEIPGIYDKRAPGL